jgi:hypothetical protein
LIVLIKRKRRMKRFYNYLKMKEKNCIGTNKGNGKIEKSKKMKDKKFKNEKRKEKFKFALSILFVSIVVAPILITFISPNISEAIHEDQGGCNVYYEDNFIPCITYKEAYFINLTALSISGGIISFLVLICPNKFLEKLDIM